MYLEKVMALLKKKSGTGEVNYSIPREWLPATYTGTVKLKDRYIFVNPNEFGRQLVESILSNKKSDLDYSQSLGRIKGESNGSWLKSAVIYGAFVRMTAAYPHFDPEFFSDLDSPQYTEPGTFYKMILMLPYLHDMGFDTLYFLPITSYSDAFKKGSLGSPYSVKNFFTLDERYHDSQLTGMRVREEFKAFVEAAHIMGIRVVLDFIPRTAARDCDLILDHPDWFYWIDASRQKEYKPPKIDKIGFDQAKLENLETVYSSEAVRKHLSLFRPSPAVSDPEKWQAFVKRNRGKRDFLEELVAEFNVITPPGFSDWINDNQPIWNDITFLRFYRDHPIASRRYVSPDQPPYVLFDVIKSSYFPGEEPTTDLWEKLENIMPFYNREFGVDGARLDMGHALPRELELRIIQSAKETDPSFSIIAEELVMGNDEKAARSGYDCILGNSWWMEPRIFEGKLKELVYRVLPYLKIPALASAETPDTPRAAARPFAKQFSKFVTALNFFLPNGVTYINSGQEIFEIQPMNLGLDNDDSGRYVLKPNDPFYGNLAFFDPYVLHWNSNEDMTEMIASLCELKKRNAGLIEVQHLKLLWEEDRLVVGLFYWNGVEGILVVGNADFTRMKDLYVDLGYHTWKGEHKVHWKLKGAEAPSQWNVGGNFRLSLGPGEIVIASIR